MRTYKITFLVSLMITVVVGCAALDTGTSGFKRHEKLPKTPDCTECHDAGQNIGIKPYSTYSHNASFFDRHGNIAVGSEAVCESCHKVKFCSDCHAVKEEIAPQRKLGNRPDLSSPHRGDYFSKHKIDGRIKRAECFKCHGRKNNATCKRCHNP